MGRGKLSMKFIGNEKSRKTTFHKRNKSLMRKAYELSTLCDVRTCVFVYGPNQNEQSLAELHTWPPSPNELNDMIASYKTNSLHKRARKSFTLLDFFSDRKKKIQADISKLRKDIAKARFPKWDERLDYLLEEQLRLLMVELDSKFDATKRRIEAVAKDDDDGTSPAQMLNNANIMMKQKQVMMYHDEEEQSYTNNNNMFGSSSLAVVDQTQPIMPFHHHQYHHHQIQTMGSSVIPTDYDRLDNLSHFFFATSFNSSFNYGTCFQNHPNLYTDIPTNNGMNNIMDSSTQNYSIGLPFAAVTQSVLPFSYMHLTEDQIMMMASSASNSQMPLLPNAASSTQLNDQFDFINYDYFKRTNNFSEHYY